MEKVIIIIAALLVAMMILLKRITYTINHDLNDYESIVGNGSLKCLILYTPSNKNDVISANSPRTMMKQLDSVINYLKTHDYTITINYPTLKHDYCLDDYDLIIFGSCVYAGQTSKSLNSFIESHNIENKDIIVFTGGGLDNEQTELESLVLKLNKNNRIKTSKITKNNSNGLLEAVKTI